MMNSLRKPAQCTVLLFILFPLSIRLWMNHAKKLRQFPNPRVSGSDDSSNVAPLPHIAYPDGAEFASELPTSVQVSGSGGWEAKFEVKVEDWPSNKFMFKPSHHFIAAKPEEGGWMFRPNKGGFVFQPDSDHAAKILNELIAYTVDQLMRLRRVPPVVPYKLDVHLIRQALQDVTTTHLSHKFLRSKMNLNADSSTDWLHDSDSIVGTLQYMLPDVTHPLKWPSKVHKFFAEALFGVDTFHEREINTRRLFDFVVGNIDRGNNNFLHDPVEENKQQPFVYIDQNSLSTDPPFGIPSGAAALRESPELCRFYREPVDRLGALINIHETVLEKMLQAELVQTWFSDGLIDQDDLGPLRHMEERRQTILAHVDECTRVYGYAYVFRD